MRNSRLQLCATDTHAQLNVTEDNTLVVAFRGTGSLANIGTDCHVTRTAVTHTETASRTATMDGLEHSGDHIGLNFEVGDEGWQNVAEDYLLADTIKVHSGFAKA